MKVLGSKDHISKKFLGTPNTVFYVGVQDETVGACDLARLPYGGSGDSRDTVDLRGRAGPVLPGFLQTLACALGSEEKRVPTPVLALWPLVI